MRLSLLRDLLVVVASLCLVGKVGADATEDTNATPSCADVCTYGDVHNDGLAQQRCEVWDDAAKQWIELNDEISLHNRARRYTVWLRKYMLPAGGIQTANFFNPVDITDATYQETETHSNINDSALWTGVYLAAEALRYMKTRAPDALNQVHKLVRTLDVFFNVSGDPGYLARYAAPVNLTEENPDKMLAINSIFDKTRRPVHGHNDGHTYRWNDTDYRWTGDVSRDQYQGPMLGLALAYEATDDEEIRELIRDNVVRLVEQLMQTRMVSIVIDIKNIPETKLIDFGPIEATAKIKDIHREQDVKLRFTAFSKDELPQPVVFSIDFNNLDAIRDYKLPGLREFYPDLKDILKQIHITVKAKTRIKIGPVSESVTLKKTDSLPKFIKQEYLRKLKRGSSAIMLASFFEVALAVTKDVPAEIDLQKGYSARRENIRAFYEQNVDQWLNIAKGWDHDENCGKSYFSYHISFLPIYNWARLADERYKESIRKEVLQDRMWAKVADHKNTLFAYIYGAHPPSGINVNDVLAFHTLQLSQFGSAPRIDEYTNLHGQYPEDPSCLGNASVAIDVADRAPQVYMWQHHPWRLHQEGNEREVYPGVDYLIAYWLGRYHDFIGEDAPNQCLQWRPIE